jgi:hypothetical protein
MDEKHHCIVTTYINRQVIPVIRDTMNRLRKGLYGLGIAVVAGGLFYGGMRFESMRIYENMTIDVRDHDKAETSPGRFHGPDVFIMQGGEVFQKRFAKQTANGTEYVLQSPAVDAAYDSQQKATQEYDRVRELHKQPR